MGQYWREGSRRYKPRANPAYLAKKRNHARPCTERREGDEYACWCGQRWDVHDERPPCLRKGK